jgi:hypothetical protein
VNKVNASQEGHVYHHAHSIYESTGWFSVIFVAGVTAEVGFK